MKEKCQMHQCTTSKSSHWFFAAGAFRAHVSTNACAAAVLCVTAENINLYAQGRFDLIEKDLAALATGLSILLDLQSHCYTLPL